MSPRSRPSSTAPAHLDLARTEGPTGYYGGRVDQGIRGFQKDNALEIDGLINPDGETLQRLGTLLSRRELSLQPSGSSSMLRPAPTEILPERPPLYTQANASVQDRVADWLGRRGALLVGARDSAAPSSLPSGLQRAAAGADDTESAQLEEPGRRASREPVPAPLGNDASAAEEPPHLTPVLDKIEQTYRRRVANLRRSGMPIAAANLEHFLDASGEARKLPRDEAIKLQPIKEAEATNNGRFVSRTFRGISERNDAVRRLPHLRQGDEPFRFEDKWDRDFEYQDYLWNTAVGDRDFAAAIGRAKFESRGDFSAVRTRDMITISGTVTHTLRDDYDFHRWQPSAEGALALQKSRGARPFPFGTEWKQPVTAVVPVKGGRLGQPKVTWGDITQ